METTPEKSILEAGRWQSLLASVNFWKLWSANSFSNLGDGLYQIAIPLLAVQLTRAPALAALTAEGWRMRAMFAIGGVVSAGLLLLFLAWVPGWASEVEAPLQPPAA